jgi:hypothetical protein
MHLDLNARIAINTSKRYAMNYPLLRSAERRSAVSAEAETGSGYGLICGNVFFTIDPGE